MTFTDNELVKMPNVISKPSVQSGALLLGAALAAGGTALCLYLLLKDEDDWKLDRGSQMATRWKYFRLLLQESLFEFEQLLFVLTDSFCYFNKKLKKSIWSIFVVNKSQLMSRFPENQLELLLDVKAVTLSRISDNLNIVKKTHYFREIQAKTDTRINFRDELETDTHRVCCIRYLRLLLCLNISSFVKYNQGSVRGCSNGWNFDSPDNFSAT